MSNKIGGLWMSQIQRENEILVSKVLNEGFIPLIEWENKYKDTLYISFPSFCYRKDNVIARILGGVIQYYNIVGVNVDIQTGYRIPELVNKTKPE